MDIFTKKCASQLKHEILEEDIGVMSFSDKVSEMATPAVVEAEVSGTTPELMDVQESTPAPVEEVVAEVTPPVVAEDVSDKTLAEINAELEGEDKKTEIMEEVETIIDKSQADLEKNEKTPMEIITQMAEEFYAMHDEQATELIRLRIAYNKLNTAYTKECEEHEDLKLKSGRGGEVDDEVRYMSKLKKGDAKSKEEYQTKLLEEVGEAYGIPPLELERELKEKKAKMAAALGGQQTNVAIPTKEEKEEKPLFSGFKLN